MNIQALTKTDLRTETRSVWDRLGVIGSALCMVHCATTPLLIGFLSTVGLGFVEREIFHQVLHLVLVGIALLAFWPAYRHHRRGGIVVAGALGATLLLVAGFGHDVLPGHLDLGLTLAGSAVLVGAHLLNSRCHDSRCQAHGECHDAC